MLNLDKTIKNLKGEEFPKSYPTQKDIDNLPKAKDGSISQKDLPVESIRNVILNCLSFYQQKDRKEGFLINIAAQAVLEGGEIELKVKTKGFIIDVLNESIILLEKTKDKEGKEIIAEKGVYRGWVIAQVLTEMGEKYEDTNK